MSWRASMRVPASSKMAPLSRGALATATSSSGLSTIARSVSGMMVAMRVKRYSRASALEALRLGASDYLSKPFDVGHLYQVIRRLTEDPDASEAPGRSRALPHALIVTEDAGLRAGLAVALRTRGRVDAVADTNAALS